MESLESSPLFIIAFAVFTLGGIGTLIWGVLTSRQKYAKPLDSEPEMSPAKKVALFIFGVLIIIIAVLAITGNFPDGGIQLPSLEGLIGFQLPDNETRDGCQVSSKFGPKILQWCEPVTKYAVEYGIDPDLIAAMIVQESGGNPSAISHQGAVGLMQVMPNDGSTPFMCENGPCFANRPSTQELLDPEFNIKQGVKILREQIMKYNNVRGGLMGYGPSGVGYYYADIVLSIYQRNKGDS